MNLGPQEPAERGYDPPIGGRSCTVLPTRS